MCIHARRANPYVLGLGTLPMQAPELAIQELRRCMNELGLRGIEIGTHINDWNLDAPELFPIFEVCCMPLLWYHTEGEMVSP